MSSQFCAITTATWSVYLREMAKEKKKCCIYIFSFAFCLFCYRGVCVNWVNGDSSKMRISVQSRMCLWCLLWRSNVSRAVSCVYRVALDSAARTPLFNRSPRWTSRHTTATTGEPTSICCQGPPVPFVEAKQRAGSLLLLSLHINSPFLLQIPSPVSRPSTCAALTVLRGGAVLREQAMQWCMMGGTEGGRDRGLTLRGEVKASWLLNDTI